MADRCPTVLTISRQLGSGGAFIGRAVAARLGMQYLDREILERAARESGADEREIESGEERTAGPWQALLRSFTFGPPEAPAVAPVLPTAYAEDVFRLESTIIRDLAERSDAVIVGRAGFHILAAHPGRVAVLVHADRNWRVRRVRETYPAADPGKVEALIDESDRRRAHFVRAVTGRPTLEAVLLEHDLAIKTSATGLELAVEMVARLVEERMRECGEPAPRSADRQA